jgi:peptide/nickel transport system permease protein
MTRRYLVRRLGGVVITLWLVSLIVFGITQILPGNAANMILGTAATPDALQALSTQLGLDRPWYVQYVTWLLGMVSGDWGRSMILSTPVRPAVLDALGRSALLGSIALVLVTVVAVPLGVWSAVRRGRITDFVVTLCSYIGISMPEFVVATVLVAVLVRPDIGWFPASGYQPLDRGFGGFLLHLLLPVVSLALVLTAHIVRQTRSEMSDVLQADFVRTARLKGLPPRAVLFRHALPNALLPTITVIALDVGYLVGGILVIEEIFAFPGLGRLMIFAVTNRDLPLLQAGTVVMATIYAGANFVADVAYAMLDRRIQYG